MVVVYYFYLANDSDLCRFVVQTFIRALSIHILLWFKSPPFPSHYGSKEERWV